MVMAEGVPAAVAQGEDRSAGRGEVREEVYENMRAEPWADEDRGWDGHGQEEESAFEERGPEVVKEVVREYGVPDDDGFYW